MSEAEFNDRVDATMEALELALDEVDDDIDYEITGGVLTLEFENCARAMVTFDFPAASQSGEFTITRSLDDNIALCEQLSAP